MIHVVVDSRFAFKSSVQTMDTNAFITSSIIFLYIFTYCINIVSSITNCSALTSYVQITSPSNLSQTLTSSQALFAPYSYYIPSTQLVKLNDSIDDICGNHGRGISSDISNKIVLIFESEGNCTNHFKVLQAQDANAIAVLLANNDNSGEVINIIDDNSLQDLETVIPMRSITLFDGNLLSNAISSGVVVYYIYKNVQG